MVGFIAGLALGLRNPFEQNVRRYRFLLQDSRFHGFPLSTIGALIFAYSPFCRIDFPQKQMECPIAYGLLFFFFFFQLRHESSVPNWPRLFEV